MRQFAPALILVLSACGGQPPTEPGSTAPSGPQSAATQDPARLAVLAGGADFNTSANVDPDIASAWSGVRIRVIDRDGGTEEMFDIPINGAELLGESGLVLSAGVFLPDFILDENGISSRSAEPINPAVRVVISEDGMEDFEGWLFASMPEIRPYPHQRWEVLLVEGIPAE